jgi:hypothetical protein
MKLKAFVNSFNKPPSGSLKLLSNNKDPTSGCTMTMSIIRLHMLAAGAADTADNRSSKHSASKCSNFSGYKRLHDGGPPANASVSKGPNTVSTFLFSKLFTKILCVHHPMIMQC